MTSRTLKISDSGKFSWSSEELPRPVGTQVLVRSIWGLIDVDEELPRFAEKTTGPFPSVFGSYILGIVEDTGEDVVGFRQGDQVVACYGRSTRGLVDCEDLILVPGPVDYRMCLLSGIAARVIEGIRRINPRPQKPVLITGCGLRGLLTVFVLKTSGKDYIDVVEPVEDRRNLARLLKARYTAGPSEIADVGGLYPVGFECSGTNEGFGILQEKMLPGGNISIISRFPGPRLHLSESFHKKGLTVTCTGDSRDSHIYARWFFDNLENSQSLLFNLFGEDTDSEHLEETFEKLSEIKDKPVLVPIRYDQ